MNQKKTLTMSATAAALLTLCTLQAANAQNVDHGKEVYAQCAACHSIDGSNGAGPSLKGVYGRQAATEPGFRFSRGMKKATYAWDDKTLDAYIADPQKALPANLMPFSGLPNAQDRTDLIAYLKTLK